MPAVPFQEADAVGAVGAAGSAWCAELSRNHAAAIGQRGCLMRHDAIVELQRLAGLNEVDVYTGGVPMELRTVPAAVRTKPPFMSCAQCGAAIHMAQWTEQLDERRVRHLWACDACGYTFETAARFPAH